jgi:hypothetical protein
MSPPSKWSIIKPKTAELYTLKFNRQVPPILLELGQQYRTLDMKKTLAHNSLNVYPTAELGGKRVQSPIHTSIDPRSLS